MERVTANGVVSKEDVDYLLKISRKDITKQLTINFFGTVASYDNGKITLARKYNTNSKMTIPVNGYKNNKQPIQTTLGKYIFNVFMIKDNLYDVLGYINEPVTGGKLHELEDILSKALLTDKITCEQMAMWLDDIQKLGFTIGAYVCPSLTPNTTRVSDKVKKKKKELAIKHKDAIEKGDPIVGAKIEKELLDLSKEDTKGDPGMDLYDSGSKASYGNNFKNLFVMKGPVKEVGTGKFNISMNNYMDGLDKNDIRLSGEGIVQGAFAKGVGTQKGGYLTKLFFAAFQSIVADRKGTDCGSLGYNEINLTKSNIDMFMYRYIIEGNRFVRIDDTNKDKYVGKTVKMRDTMYCKSDKICNRCLGDMYYLIEMENVGLTTVKVSSSIMNKSLKKFHDTSIKLSEVDLNDLVL